MFLEADSEMGEKNNMRKQRQKILDDYLQLLYEAHTGIKKELEHKNRKTTMDLLGQCQRAAISMGTMLEEDEGEDLAAVRMLEDYCELAYRFYDALERKETISPKQIERRLTKLLAEIESSMNQDIQIRKEAVFLPYKASMWDSLESVWKVANADDDYDVYVIPIPYYERNPDGSFGQMHYEADQFPDYVPVTHYNAYHFEKNHPDIIFIHNPYDNNNYVTSVHPFFYSKNLKRFTELLVYIPYFILDEIDPNIKEMAEEIKHYCLVPGMLHADQVIVQSEAMRQVYIQIMTEYTKKGEKDQEYWGKKILGLGSPKVDRIYSLKRNELEIPQDWMKVIYKLDGSLKKVILYNVSVGPFLNKSQEMLEKMEEVFRFFNKREDAVLLWRPHPLLENTISSMRPKLYKEYKRLKEKFIRENMGIYDDTSDMYTAIGLSDAYYGDWSSLVWLYRYTGKPVMIQDVK